MTGDQLEAILKNAKSKADDQGFAALQEGNTFTLYVAHDGAPLTIPRVEGVKRDGDMVYARTHKRELFAVVISDVFAVAVDGAPGTPARRAGFG